MPYLTNSMKAQANQNPLFGKGDPGVLNYRLTQTIIEWLGKEPKYADFNAAIGALESAKLELYRRSVAAYEDVAIDRNGDVYPEELLPMLPDTTFSDLFSSMGLTLGGEGTD